MKIGLTLSGGGTRGIAHLGMIKAMEEMGLEFSIISGTSAGAMAGALYSYGYSPDDIYKIIVDTNFLKFIRPAISKTGLLKMESAESLYRKYLPEDSFASLKKALIIATTDLTVGKTVFFSDGELIRPLMASSCIPVIFDPISIGNNLYVDGGILNNFPVEPLVGHCDINIGLHCNPINHNFHATNFKAVMQRTFLLQINANAHERKLKCDLLLEPSELAGINVFDLARAKDIFDFGYDYAYKQKENILTLVSQKEIPR